MTYAISASLQAAVFQRLAADTTLAGLVGTAIYDAIPPGILPTLYVALGPEKARDRSDKTGSGAEHEFTISVVTEAAGFVDAKIAAAAISDALIDAPLVLTRGSLVSLNFYRAVAARISNGTARQIDLIFRARVDGD